MTLPRARVLANEGVAGQEGMCGSWIGFLSLQPEKLSRRGLEAMKVAVLFGQISLGRPTVSVSGGG